MPKLTLEVVGFRTLGRNTRYYLLVLCVHSYQACSVKADQATSSRCTKALETPLPPPPFYGSHIFRRMIDSETQDWTQPGSRDGEDIRCMNAFVVIGAYLIMFVSSTTIALLSIVFVIKDITLFDVIAFILFSPRRSSGVSGDARPSHLTGAQEMLPYFEEIGLSHIRSHPEEISSSLAPGSNSASGLRRRYKEDLATTLVGSSESLEPLSEAAPAQPRIFQMLLHLAGNNSAQRVASLDTAGEVDVISMQTVKSLGLRKKRYEGGPVGEGRFSSNPQWQTTFDWHVAGFYKTYTSTFVVSEEAHSGDFDIVIGRPTIEEINFYLKSTKIW
ncbi:MAG: hypothetical protein Q9176_003793 [Flavoplaca citrina]